MAGEIIRPSALTTDRASPVASEFMVVDNGVTVAKSTVADVVMAGRPSASQAEAEAGVDAAKAMTPLTVKQSIYALGDVRFASAAQGALADAALQSVVGSSEISVDDTDPQNPVISYTGSGVTDGDKGDLTVTGAGAVWSLNNEVVSPSNLTDDDAMGFRMAANVRGRVNFFDFLQDTRSSAVREAIMNGTSTADLAVEWGQFRDALWDIADAGGRPHGFIPESKIYTSVAENFAMDNLTLETQGMVRVRAIGAVNALVIDGNGLGVGSFGVRNMNIGPMMVETAAGAYAGYFRKVHQSEFHNLRCGGAVTAGFKVDGCVSSVWRKLMVSSQPEAMIATPGLGLHVTGVIAGQTSWCLFDMPILENVPIGLLIERGLGNSFVSGTSEGNSNVGLYLAPTSQWNKFYGMDMEVNTNFDIYCEGLGNEFYGTDAAGGHTIFTATAANNRVFGGTFSQIDLTSGSTRNRITGINYNANGTGYLADAGQNVLRDNCDLGSGALHSGDIVGSTAIDITVQAVEDTLRTWPNSFAQNVLVVWGAAATSAWYKTSTGSRYGLPAGGGSVILAPGDKIQIGYTSAPAMQFRFA